MKLFFHVCITLLVSSSCFANVFEPGATYEVCFTPGNNCTNKITNIIENAKKSIYVQAYSFTSAQIAKALVDAYQSGIYVLIILDKSQVKNNRYSSSKFFINQNIPVYIDYKPAIAHNKVMIIDDKILITGSFNFTKAAQEKNAENILIITDKSLAKIYYNYFRTRLGKSNKL